MSPKSKEQFEEIRQRSAANILQAALELFAHKGFNGTSISQIAKEAGVSKGLLYNYYSGKEALLDAIVMGAMEEGDHLMEDSIQEGVPPKEQLQHLVEFAFAMIAGNIDYWKLIFSLSFQSETQEKYGPLMIAKAEEQLGQLEALFTQMKRKNPKQEAMLLAASMDGVAMHFMTMGKNYSLEEMKDHIIEKFCG